tara:strand:+ start:57 stop:467 length:411 start_codon:yes stop_codon:yes gene_type:complete
MSGKDKKELLIDRHPTGAKEALEEFSSPEEEAKNLENRLRKQDLEQRKEYAERAYGLTQTWVGFIIVITVSQMTFSAMGIGHLESSEFIAVITTTTVTILGFWALVGRGLFGTHQSGRIVSKSRKTTNKSDERSSN